MKRVAALVFLCALGSLACFGDPVITFSSSSGRFIGHGAVQTVGWGFTVNQAVTVTDLYWYDPTQSFTKGFAVDIWTSAGSFVTGTSCVGFGCSGGSYDSADGYWDTPITGVVLAPGTYVIGGLIAASDPIQDQIASFLTNDPRITYSEDLAIIVATLAMPTSSNGGQEKGYFGPNFGVLGSTSVPEPGTFPLLGLSAASALMLFRRRNA
jgi:hypothetical protein